MADPKNVTNSKAEEYERTAKVIVWIGGFLLAGVIILYISYFNDGFSINKVDWGLFGDYLGGTLGAIFSFLALCLLFITIRYQSHELKLTREEFERSTEALNKQNDHLKIQQVQSMLFNLLARKDLLLSNMHYAFMEGYDAINEFLRKLDMKVNEHIEITNKGRVISQQKIIEGDAHTIPNTFNPYFKLFCSTCIYLQKQTIPDEVREVSIKIFSDNLTFNEKRLLRIMLDHEIYNNEVDALDCSQIVDEYDIL